MSNGFVFYNTLQVIKVLAVGNFTHPQLGRTAHVIGAVKHYGRFQHNGEARGGIKNRQEIECIQNNRKEIINR